jgi:D-glycero-D-manno-heptose 1,7-bisphosphate phosphatase
VGVDALKPPAVFLDRDGVLNRAVIKEGKPYPPASVEQLEILPGVAEALDRLKAAGYRLVVVTNQPDIARGATSPEAVEAIHRKLRETLRIDEIRVCPHDDADECPCRKPKAGLLLTPATVDVGASIMVGDRWRDIEAGRAAGCRSTILVDYGYAEELFHEPDVRVSSLAEAAQWILMHADRRPAHQDLR